MHNENYIIHLLPSLKNIRKHYIKQSICQRVLRNNNNVYWNEIKKGNLLASCHLFLMIVILFEATYGNLYNSIYTHVHIVDSLYNTINKLILDSHETRKPHNYRF